MIKWDYRVFKEENGDYIIREVFYNDKKSIVSCTQDAVEPFGSSLEDLSEQIEVFKQALKLPVLTLADVPLKEKTMEKQNGHQIVYHKQNLAELSLA